jgi:hypothetical protein
VLASFMIDNVATNFKLGQMIYATGLVGRERHE